MNFSSKKRPRTQAWKELQRELDERERVEEENATKFARLDALKARTALEEDIDASKTHVYMDIRIGRDMGREPKLTRGRLIFELFDDIMPRTVEQFIRLLESTAEPTYKGSAISKILPGYMCEAGVRLADLERDGSPLSEIPTPRLPAEPPAH
jgi:DNA-directed RNA polymerase subunit F